MAESVVEKIKKESNSLRGTLKESLLDEHTGAIQRKRPGADKISRHVYAG